MSTPTIGSLDASDARSVYGADIVDLETARYGLLEVARDMHQSLMRGAFSPIVRDINDCTACIHMRTPAGWEMVASREGCMQHAFISQHVCNFTMDEYGEENLKPGDVLLVNDPWRGAVHASDINLLRPVFVDGKPLFVLHSTSHVVDLGGPIPGGFANGATTHFEEQIKFPPTLLYAEDIPNRSIFNFILENVRVPDAVLGDIRALYGCLIIGERRLREVIAKHSTDVVQAGARYGMDLTEASMRAGIAAIPDGDYRIEDELDDDGVTREPVPLVATLKIRGDSMEVDYSGTGRQPAGNVGTAWCESSRCVEGIKFIVDPSTPVNSGTMRPIQALLPVGSAVCSLPPTSVSNHVEIGSRVVNMMTQALSEAVSARAMACDSGTIGMLTLGGIDGRAGHEGTPWGSFALAGGGWGATSAGDGLTFCVAPIGNCRTSVNEHVEKESPLIVWQHEIMADTAGAGKYRGGFGSIFTVSALSETTVTITGDRARSGPPGVEGGGRAMSLYAWLIPDFDPARGLDPLDLRECEPLFGIFDKERRPAPDTGTFGAGTSHQTAKIPLIVLKPGQALRMIIGGGGGWGDPLERDLHAVTQDIEDGLYSPAFAKAAFGIELRDGAIDDQATTLRRQTLASKREQGEWAVPTAASLDWKI